MPGPDPRSYAAICAAWRQETARLSPEILRDAVAYNLANLTELLIAAADRELRSLREQLDDIKAAHQVWLCPDAYLAQAALDSTDAQPGQILRATDTGRELVFTAGGAWEPVPP